MTLAAASGGMSMYGAYQQGQTQDAYYKYLAESNELEAQAAEKTAETQSTLAQDEAARKAKELKGEVSRVEGAQKAAMAAMGLTGVTAEDVLVDTTNRAKLDADNIRYNADIQSWMANKEGAERAWSLRNQGTLFGFAGKQAKRAAMINMTSTLLGTASSIIGGLGDLKIPAKSSVITGGEGGINTGYQYQTVFGKRQIIPTWSPGKLY
ncbi:MAG: hypothetical protein JXB40_05775 [Candidatus Omnitrophica bacterium]|nr:hypothetical protein [Candidatus Omnitrophota bacterium]